MLKFKSWQLFLSDFDLQIQRRVVTNWLIDYQYTKLKNPTTNTRKHLRCQNYF